MKEPRRPTGDGRGTPFFQWVWDRLAKELKFADSPSVKWSRTTNGISASVNVPAVDSSRLQTYRVKEAPSESEYLVCRTWDGTTEGTNDVIVAKPFDARQPATQTLGGTAYTFTYAATVLDAFNDFRVSNDGSTNETQLVTPLWFEDALILVAKVSFSGVLYDDTVHDPYDLKLIEVSPRCWAKVEEPPA